MSKSMRWARMWAMLLAALVLTVGLASAAQKKDAANPRKAQKTAQKKAKTPPSNVPYRTRTDKTPTWSIVSGDVTDVVALSENSLKALRRGIENLSKTYPEKYTGGAGFLKRLDALEKAFAADPADPKAAEDFKQLRAEATLANPLLDFGQLLLVKRNENKIDRWQSRTDRPGPPKSNHNRVPFDSMLV